MVESGTKPRRPRAAATYLWLLLAIAIVPITGFSAYLLSRAALEEHRDVERQAVQIADLVARVVDNELSGMLSLLKGLSASSALQDGDFAQFHREASRLVAGSDQIVVLRSLEETQFLNTQVPFGEILPPAPPVAPVDRNALLSGRTVVSNVYQSPISGEYRIAIVLPVSAAGAPAALAITVPTADLRDTLVAAAPNGWTVSIGDRQGVVVARSQRHDEFTGQPGLPAYLEKAVGRAGTFRAVGFDGVELIAGYLRSDFSGWLYAANIPTSVVETPVWTSILALAAAGAVAVLASGGLAFALATRFSQTARGLRDRAIALGEGRAVEPLPTTIAEFKVVADAMTAAERRLRERSHELEVVLGTVPAAVWFTYDPDVKRVVRNPYASALMRVPEAATSSLASPGTELSHLRLLKDGEGLHPDQLPLQRAMRGEIVEDEEYTFAFDDGTSSTILTSARALRGSRNEIVGAVSVSIDITERKRNEEQRRLLTNELNHRVKNTLTTVQSIASQTLRGPGSKEDAQRALSARLIALARAHDLLTREHWEGANLVQLAVLELGPYVQQATRIKIDGAPVMLTPPLTLALALALHELTTNAVKYGALSNDTGTVALSWRIDTGSVPSRLILNWAESGGPVVTAPSREGFGTLLLRQLFAHQSGGTSTVDYRPEGVAWTLEFPLPEDEPKP